MAVYSYTRSGQLVSGYGGKASTHTTYLGSGYTQRAAATGRKMATVKVEVPTKTVFPSTTTPLTTTTVSVPAPTGVAFSSTSLQQLYQLLAYLMYAQYMRKTKRVI